VLMNHRHRTGQLAVAFALAAGSAACHAQAFLDKAYNCNTPQGGRSIRAFLPNGTFYAERKGEVFAQFTAVYKLNRGNTKVLSAVGVGYQSPRMKQAPGGWQEMVHLNAEEYLVGRGGAKVFIDGELLADCVDLSEAEKRSAFEKATLAAEESRQLELPNPRLAAARALPRCSESTDLGQQVYATEVLALEVMRAMLQAEAGSRTCQSMANIYASKVLRQADDNVKDAMAGHAAGRALLRSACESYRLVAGNLLAQGCARP
jgi:hypothetical protein